MPFLPREAKDAIESLTSRFLDDSGRPTDQEALLLVANLAENYAAATHELGTLTPFRQVLAELGIVGYVSKLEGSDYTPTECISRVAKNYSFMGILGAKYVQAGPTRSAFEKFLTRMQKTGGLVRFLLIDPECDAFKKLKSSRREYLEDLSTGVFDGFARRYSSLNVKYYGHDPLFRLMIIDDSEIAVSRYQIAAEGYIETNYGWESPHLVIRPARGGNGIDQSLFDPFRYHFELEWERARDRQTPGRG